MERNMRAVSVSPIAIGVAATEAAGIATSPGTGAAFHMAAGRVDQDGWYFEARFAQSLHRDA
jgi:hypothetical protein